MADLSPVAAKVRPNTGAIIRRFNAASSSVAVGKAVYVKSDGKIELADADAVGSAQARGIVVAIGVLGALTANAGDPCDVVMFGSVELGLTGLTEGGAVYVSATAGAMDQTAPSTTGQYKFAIGWAESDTAIFVAPQVIVPTVNP